jgi:hypothetical protein
MEQTAVTIQITQESKPAIPCWIGEVAAFAQVQEHAGILKAIYELIDFVVVLIGYALSSESTLLAFYERLAPFAASFKEHDLSDSASIEHSSKRRKACWTLLQKDKHTASALP